MRPARRQAGPASGGRGVNPLAAARPAYRRGRILDAVMVDGKPHCPECRVPAYGIVDYGPSGDGAVQFVVVCPNCQARVRYTRALMDI